MSTRHVSPHSDRGPGGPGGPAGRRPRPRPDPGRWSSPAARSTRPRLIPRRPRRRPQGTIKSQPIGIITIPITRVYYDLDRSLWFWMSAGAWSFGAAPAPGLLRRPGDTMFSSPWPTPQPSCLLPAALPFLSPGADQAVARASGVWPWLPSAPAALWPGKGISPPPPLVIPKLVPKKQTGPPLPGAAARFYICRVFSPAGRPADDTFSPGLPGFCGCDDSAGRSGSPGNMPSRARAPHKTIRRHEASARSWSRRSGRTPLSGS